MGRQGRGAAEGPPAAGSRVVVPHAPGAGEGLRAAELAPRRGGGGSLPRYARSCRCGGVMTREGPRVPARQTPPAPGGLRCPGSTGRGGAGGKKLTGGECLLACALNVKNGAIPACGAQMQGRAGRRPASSEAASGHAPGGGHLIGPAAARAEGTGAAAGAIAAPALRAAPLRPRPRRGRRCARWRQARR